MATMSVMSTERTDLDEAPEAQAAAFAELRRLLTQSGHLVVRPPETVANLPPRYRWEFTRRHSYYLAAWDEVARHRRGESRSLGDWLVGAVGTAALLAIGVSGEPVDPALEFDDPAFGGDNPFVISGACQPVTLRALAVLLTHALPATDRVALGTLLFHSGSRQPDSPQIDEQEVDQTLRQRCVGLIRGLPGEAFNSIPLWPLFHIHLGSSLRTIHDDVAEQVRLRGRGQRPARAIRPEVLNSYLEVWDAREGWTGRGYARRLTERFSQITSQRARSTVYDHYRRAFRLIVGPDYRNDLWWALFGLLKFNQYLADDRDGAVLGATPKREQRQSGQPAQQPAEGSPSDDSLLDGVTEARLAVMAWLEAGVPHAEIAERLGVDPARFTEFASENEDRSRL